MIRGQRAQHTGTGEVVLLMECIVRDDNGALKVPVWRVRAADDAAGGVETDRIVPAYRLRPHRATAQEAATR